MLFEYFASPDDETAAGTIDGRPLGATVRSHVVDPASVLGQLERLLGARRDDDGLLSAQMIAESEDGARLVIRLSAHILSLYGRVQPDTVKLLVDQWSMSRRFRRGAVDEDLYGFAAGLHALCREGRVYCRASADPSELTNAPAPAPESMVQARTEDGVLRPLPRRV
ncbi:hypothetical protein [Myceligenerans indicum]|uniref:Uncharacterized protein n=1 Tax=Myceligenerans indicum TaxID=2593663 RepID=A0ABS1LIM8_9MICO|nr:hypothetical protein [Myceligenerans indicum]MBL0886013.1 hypothetical protein [Myceligenerans indicum]